MKTINENIDNLSYSGYGRFMYGKLTPEMRKILTNFSVKEFNKILENVKIEVEFLCLEIRPIGSVNGSVLQKQNDRFWFKTIILGEEFKFYLNNKTHFETEAQRNTVSEIGKQTILSKFTLFDTQCASNSSKKIDGFIGIDIFEVLPEIITPISKEQQSFNIQKLGF